MPGGGGMGGGDGGGDLTSGRCGGVGVQTWCCQS